MVTVSCAEAIEGGVPHTTRETDIRTPSKPRTKALVSVGDADPRPRREAC